MIVLSQFYMQEESTGILCFQISFMKKFYSSVKLNYSWSFGHLGLGQWVGFQLLTPISYALKEWLKKKKGDSQADNRNCIYLKRSFIASLMLLELDVVGEFQLVGLSLFLFSTRQTAYCGKGIILSRNFIGEKPRA